MAWDKSYYQQVKTFVKQQIYRYGTCPSVFIKVFDDCVADEDYEGAQATKDVLVEWIKKMERKGLI